MRTLALCTGRDEDGLRQVELGRDRLHAGVVEAFGIEHHGERVAGERPVGEDVEDGVAARQAVLHGQKGRRLWPALPRPVKVSVISDRKSATRTVATAAMIAPSSGPDF
jgi:hypothetical protein